MPPTEQLSFELEAAALRAVAREWDTLNYTFFRSRMRPPTFGVTDSASHMARWFLQTRTIEVSRATLLEHPWGVVIEVLKHEMAHQYVHEVLGRTDETSHGPTFRAVCEQLGIDARAAGVPTAAPTTSEQAVVLERIRKLLALAESPNEHEAQSAMNAAQKLMLKYNLDAVTRHDDRRYCYRHLGAPTGRVDEAQRVLASILHDHFFVETIWVSVWRVREGRAGSVLEVCGTSENLEMAEYVHSFLHHTADALWVQHKRKKRIAGDKDRRAYRAGVMAGFWEKLNAQKKTNHEQGLVWVGDPELHGYFRKRFPRIRTVSRSSGGYNEAHMHGREAGRNIVLHKGVGGGSGAGRGGQLGPGGE